MGVMLPTSGAMPMALLGTWMAGRTSVPLNYLLGRDELRYVVGHSGVDTILTAGPMLEFVGGRDVLPADVKVVCLEQLNLKRTWPVLLPARCRVDDPAVILYTSGTSGKPKGVVLTHGNLRANVTACIEQAELERANTFLGVLPQFHSFGLTTLTLIPLKLGAKVVYSARFVPRKMVELIRRHRAEILLAIPAMYKAMLTVKEAGAEDLASVRMAVSGGSRCRRRRRRRSTSGSGFG